MEARLERDKRLLFDQLWREIRDEKALEAIHRVPRELFVPPESRHLAYNDIPVPIGDGQTISQPYMVALMVSALELREGERVMEIGTGSGYQAAVLSELVPQARILTLERLPALAHSASERLSSLGYHNVDVRIAGEMLGCPDESPFDGIIVAAASPRLPEDLLRQMSVRGRLVIPVGTLAEQELVKVLRTGEGHNVRMLGSCRFVPLVGRDAWPENNGEP